MKEKEKAYEIINNMSDYAAFTDEDCCFTERETMYKNAKALALIAVDEILKAINPFGQFSGKDYWQEVRNYIQDFEIINK